MDPFFFEPMTEPDPFEPEPYIATLPDIFVHEDSMVRQLFPNMDHHRPRIDMLVSQQEWQSLLDRTPVPAAAIMDPTRLAASNSDYPLGETIQLRQTYLPTRAPSEEAQKPKPKRLTKSKDTRVQSTISWGAGQLSIGPAAVPKSKSKPKPSPEEVTIEIPKSKSKLKRPPEDVTLELNRLEEQHLSDDNDEEKLPALPVPKGYYDDSASDEEADEEADVSHQWLVLEKELAKERIEMGKHQGPKAEKNIRASPRIAQLHERWAADIVLCMKAQTYSTEEWIVYLSTIVDFSENKKRARKLRAASKRNGYDVVYRHGQKINSEEYQHCSSIIANYDAELVAKSFGSGCPLAALALVASAAPQSPMAMLSPYPAAVVTPPSSQEVSAAPSRRRSNRGSTKRRRIKLKDSQMPDVRAFTCMNGGHKLYLYPSKEVHEQLHHARLAFAGPPDSHTMHERRVEVARGQHMQATYKWNKKVKPIPWSPHQIRVQKRKLNDLIDKMMLYMERIKDEAPNHGTKVLRLDWVDHCRENDFIGVGFGTVMSRGTR